LCQRATAWWMRVFHCDTVKGALKGTSVADNLTFATIRNSPPDRQHLLDWFDGQHLPSSKRTPKGHHVKPRTTILAIVCLAASWYYATSLSSMVRVGLKVGVVGDF